jgi:hypothetical protein
VRSLIAEMAAQVEEEYRVSVAETVAAELEQAIRSAAAKARRDVSERLNRVARALAQAATQEQFNKTLLDAAAGFCGRTALFSVAAERLRCEGARGFDTALNGNPFQGKDAPLAQAPAFANAVDSRDTVVAARTAGELSEAMFPDAGAGGATRVYLFPIVNRHNTMAVLYAEAEADSVELGALELLTTLAGAALERRSPAVAQPSNLVTLTGGVPRKSEPPVAPWVSLSPAEQEQHLRAQRSARVQVAEMRLYNSQAVQAGRTERNLYSHLRGEIEAARGAYRSEFLGQVPGMPDYLHLELVRTLANDDSELLGPDYPGPLAA